MSVTSLVIIVVGLGLVIAGYLRTRGPYARLRALQAQDQNVARYNAWRGGVRDDSKTDDLAAGAVLRRQVQLGAGLGFVGIALVFVGLLIR